VLLILADDDGWPKSMRRRIHLPTIQPDAGQSLCDIPCDQLPFSGSTVELLLAAEREGVLVSTLDSLSDDFISQDATRRAVRAAIFWPLTALMVLALMLALADVYLLPAFQRVYVDAGVRAPLSTRTLGIFLDWTFGLWWFWIPVAAILVVISVTRRWPRSVQARCAALCFALPFVRRYLKHRHVIRVARWLEVVVAGSVLRIEILRYLHETQLVPKLQRSIRHADEALNAGASYSAAMLNSSLPRRLSLFLKVGEMNNDPGASLQLFLAVAIAEERESLSRFERGVLLLSYLIVGTLVALFVSGIYGSISYLARTV
jgi:type II secretory pathway component PulF